jgi:ATP-dependent RNA helicase DDX24/MAK5
MQTAWMVATGGVELHPTLCASLLSQKFWTPTPIQSATLPASILGRRNIVGAAPTGSGKTLAYLLPILQSLLSQESETRVLQALVLTPTRELALQVSRECDLLAGEKRLSATIVGGLALAKQQRVLEKNKPPILVATPGRLWELVSNTFVL